MKNTILNLNNNTAVQFSIIQQYLILLNYLILFKMHNSNFSNNLKL